MVTDSDFRSLVRQAVAVAGSQAALAAKAGVSQQEISRLCTRAKAISGEMAIAIEQATNFAIPRGKLRPDLWPEAPPAEGKSRRGRPARDVVPAEATA